MSEIAHERPASRGAWLAWPLVVLCALPLAVTVVVARRVLSGSSPLFGQPSGELPLRERVALLLNFTFNEIHLLPPLLGLVCLLWLARRESTRRPPGSALWGGALVAAGVGVSALAQCALIGYLFMEDPADDGEFGFFGPNASLLEFFGARAATSLLLAALAIGLALVLVSTARRPAEPSDTLLDEEPPEPAPRDTTAPEPDPEPAEAADADPHARYRRPS